ncbi:MAG: C69 family dipeptidase [Bacteroidales bacterium]|nr:C69 family dipeptidase [Bacteroidales bacterium]
MNKIHRFLAIGLTVILSVTHFNVEACTSFLITRGASADGTTMITYAADGHGFYGELYFRPAATHPPGSWYYVKHWHHGRPMGRIRQVAQTYQVVGNMNEHGLAISESTFGGRSELHGERIIERGGTAIIDYGNLIYITLQRARNARQAIRIMHELTLEWGYASSGESFSIMDPYEVWHMELIGMGVENPVARNRRNGIVWVAKRIPDGYISGHANHARITTFPEAPARPGRTPRVITCRNINMLENTPSIEVIYAHDIVQYARDIGIFTGTHAQFSFSDVYAPLDFGAMRFCEARVWSGFRKANPELMAPFERYARGEDPSVRMPLWIRPDRPLTLADVKCMMRDHFQGTSLCMVQEGDIGAGPWGLPYRARPMRWTVCESGEGQVFVHERAISTQQTGFSFVAQGRSQQPVLVGGQPNPLRGILWFGVDDTYTTVWVPMYAGINEVPLHFRVGNGSSIEFSETSAFWLMNLVSNFAWLRWRDMIVDIKRVQQQLEEGFRQRVAENDRNWANITDHAQLVQLTTDFSREQTQIMFDTWTLLQRYLLVKFVDGNIAREVIRDANAPFPHDREFKVFPYSERYGSQVIQYPPYHPRFPDWFYQQTVDQIGSRIQWIDHE